MGLCLKLGTRKSSLAWAQSSWVARLLEKTHPDLQVELVGMETQGDRITDIPLWKTEGKEFFSAELDAALIKGEVDLTVHSMKDLSLDRPAELILGAMPGRENPRDVILFCPETELILKEGQLLKVGTSSPRRQENLPTFLNEALPWEEKPHFELCDLRGNVDTRISRLFEPKGSDRKLHAVVLAFAGLIRLWADPKGREKIRKSLERCRWMVLPLDLSPSAPGQGALAIECRKNDSRTFEFLQAIHQSQAWHNVSLERSLLKEWGGGCHQRFGATSLPVGDYGDLLFIRGKKQTGEHVEETQWFPRRPLPHVEKSQPWDGTQVQSSVKDSYLIPGRLGPAVFVAHSRAVREIPASYFAGSRVWVSGFKSWQKLAKLGIWVEGCGESLGFESMRGLLQEPVLNLPLLSQWQILTHTDAAEGWEQGIVTPTYELDLPEAPPSDLRTATHLYWNSGSQFERWGALAKKDAIHSSGPGKTTAHLQNQPGLNVEIFPSVKEWRSWLKI